MVKKFNSTKKWQPNEKPKQTKNSINDRNCMWIVDCFRHFCFGCCFPLSVFHVFYKKYIELWRALKLNALKTKCWSKLTENICATRYRHRHRTNRREREREKYWIFINLHFGFRVVNWHCFSFTRENASSKKAFKQYKLQKQIQSTKNDPELWQLT